MGELAAHDHQTVQGMVDDLIRTATRELFRSEARRAQGVENECLACGARVRFSGSGGAGFLALGSADASRASWAVEGVEAIGARLEKRLRQFGLLVRCEAPEALEDRSFGPTSEAPSLRSTHRFRAGDGEALIHLEGHLDVERIVGAGEVPLRDEGDIILF